ncbi:MAG: exo-beta-N-acetylmuramidase NamZ domain-containing protein [Cyclobacteriaceae bacterium]
MRPITLICLLILSLASSCQSQIAGGEKIITPAAWQTEEYLPLLQGKQVAAVVNNTSRIGNTHLVDSLLARGVNIKTIFSPEHGFRGDAAAGETVQNSVDTKTGIPIISLYGKNKKPLPEQLEDIDLVIFDIQDVGARFYTYISTMHYVMEACAEQGKQVVVLDRPNPNGYYVDGPVLDMKLQSFVGMHPIPIVHGLTVGELALMINGEGWLNDGLQCELTVVEVENYNHADFYSLPVPPSPNLPNDKAINLYPSICLFEGTVISLGRGTPFPFQVLGYPDPSFTEPVGVEVQVQDTFSFVPQDIPGVAMNPKHEGERCYGLDLRDSEHLSNFSLKYLTSFYSKARNLGISNEDYFREDFFDLLAGTQELREQLMSGVSAEVIRHSWAEELSKYKRMRKKYLLYEDFE